MAASALARELSGGQKKRVFVARALAQEPQFVVLDEPPANVDLAAGRRFAELIHRLAERRTIVMVSHDLGFVSDLVECVICVNRTAVIHPTTALHGDFLHSMYGENVRLVRHDTVCTDESHHHV
jgi:zinc transport system ATP-binding protein